MAIKKWRWLDLSDTLTPLPLLIRILNERLKLLASTIESIIININNGGGGSQIDGLYAAEGFLFNAGNVLMAGESDWLDIPTDFVITNAEIVADPAGTISVDVYVSPYGSWDAWTKISGPTPITLTGGDKNRLPALTGWTTTFTGGRYLKFVVTGTPTLITKATVTLTLAVPAPAGSGVTPGGPAGGVLGGNFPDPTFAEDMATQAELDAAVAAAQAYTDAKVAGLSWKQAVRAATTAAGTLASSFENGDAIDGVTLATGDRILIKNQTSAAENGIYVVNASGAPTRAPDADSGAELVNASVYVSEGSLQSDTQWTCSTNAPITLGVSAVIFAQLSSGGGASTALYTIWDPLIPDASPHALTDEFTSNTLAGYTMVYGNGDSTALVDIATTKPGAAYFNLPSIQWHWHSLLKALPAGDFSIYTAARLGARNSGSDGQAAGLILSTASTAGSGAQIGALIGRFPQTAGGGLQISGMLTWNGFGSSASGAALSLTNYHEDGLAIIRLRRVGTTVTMNHSTDGKTWGDDRGITNASWTHFGIFGLNYGGVSPISASFEFLRYYSVGTQLTTGALRAVYG